MHGNYHELTVTRVYVSRQVIVVCFGRTRYVIDVIASLTQVIEVSDRPSLYDIRASHRRRSSLGLYTRRRRVTSEVSSEPAAAHVQLVNNDVTSFIDLLLG